MILERFPEIEKLSAEDQWTLYEELGKKLFEDEPVTDPMIIAELERRMKEYRKDPKTAKPWPEVKERLTKEFLQNPSE
jgi:putative addiction module component (TIGR02574 family)